MTVNCFRQAAHFQTRQRSAARSVAHIVSENCGPVWPQPHKLDHPTARPDTIVGMAGPESISDLLATQPTEALETMDTALGERIDQLEVERGLVQRELQKRRSTRSRAGKRVSGLRRDDVLASLRRVGIAAPPALTELVNEGGYDATVNAVRNHLVRLVEDGLAQKHQDGRYSVVTSANGTGPNDPLASGHQVQAQVGTT